MTAPFCAICTEERPGAMRVLDGRRVFVCERCDTEHPRSGRYSFEGIAAAGVLSCNGVPMKGRRRPR